MPCLSCNGSKKVCSVTGKPEGECGGMTCSSTACPTCATPHSAPKYRGQDNPKDQIRVVLGSIMMDLANVQDGRLSKERQVAALARMQAQLTDVRDLIVRYMAPGEWGPDEDTLLRREQERRR